MTATKAVGTAAGDTGSVVGAAIAGAASRVSEAAYQVGGAIFSGAEGAATVVSDDRLFFLLARVRYAAASAAHAYLAGMCAPRNHRRWLDRSR
jgi:hypothetical protein